MKRRTQAKQKFFGDSDSHFNRALDIAYQFDSSLESHYYLKKRFEHVEFIQSQPAHVEYYLNDRLVKYTADFEVIENYERFYDEVKPRKKLLDRDFLEKKAFLETLFREERDATFRVITEDDIYQGQNISNMMMLLPSLNHPAPIIEFNQLSNALDNRSYTLKEIDGLAKQLGIATIFVRRAIAHGMFCVDLSLPKNQWLLSVANRTFLA